MPLNIEKMKEQQYAVADGHGIRFARFTILELNQGQKNALVRLRFSRKPKEAELTDLLTKVYSSLTKGGAIAKVSFLVAEDVPTAPFTRLGFRLEGVLRDHVYQVGVPADEYIFGVDGLHFGLRKSGKLLSLEGERLELRIAGPEEAADYLDYYLANRSFLAAFEPRKEDDFYTLDGQIKELTNRFHQFLNGQALNFGIYRYGRLIGKAQIANLVYGSFQSATIGYALSKDHLNQGYMSEAVGILCRYCFEDLGLHRLEASTLVNNEPSQHVLANNGFQLLGLNPAYLKIDGRWQDHKTYYLLKEEWESNWS